MQMPLATQQLGATALRSVAVLALVLASVGCGPRLLNLSFPPMKVQAAGPKPPPPPPKTEQIHITERVVFEVNSATLKSASNKVLDQVVEVLKKNADIALVEVQGHTDASGTPEKNQLLSQQRAEAVVAYMTKSGGVAAERLRAKGFGQDKPLADNDSAEGKQKNRRVEFHIIKRAPKGGE
jgi:outer membrane protein OmpA-like peptidoglycan-associated protein